VQEASAADPEITAETCGMYGKAKQVRSCGLSVQQVLCPTCPLATSCIYQARKAEAKAAEVRFACHAQGAQDLSQVAAGRDALIIDEDAIGALVRHVVVRPKHLLAVLRVLRTLAKAKPKLCDDETQLLLDLFSQATERLLAGVRKSRQAGATLIDTSGLQVPDEAQQVRWGCKLWRLLGHTGQAAPPKDAITLLLDVITGRLSEVWVTHDLHNDGHWDRQLVGILLQYKFPWNPRKKDEDGCPCCQHTATMAVESNADVNAKNCELRTNASANGGDGKVTAVWALCWNLQGRVHTYSTLT
jgi:hypothetical protein